MSEAFQSFFSSSLSAAKSVCASSSLIFARSQILLNARDTFFGCFTFFSSLATFSNFFSRIVRLLFKAAW